MNWLGINVWLVAIAFSVAVYGVTYALVRAI